MPPESWDEQSLLAYLLGELPRESSGRLENDYLRDDELFSRLCSSEQELLDAYLRGELTAERRQQFHAVYLIAAARRQRVAAEHEWFEAAKMVRDRAPSGVTARLQQWLRRFSGNGSPTIRYAVLGGALAALLLSPWFAYRTVRLGDENRRLRADLSANAVSSRPFASFVLVPGLERDGRPPKRLAISPEVARVILHLDMTGVARYLSYRAAIRVVGGPEVWSGIVKVEAATATAEVPATALTRADYTLRLEGIFSNGSAQAAATYVFGVSEPR